MIFVKEEWQDFLEIIEFLKSTLQRLGESQRWRYYPTRKHHENVLEHTMEGVWLGVIIINLEMSFGNHQFDPYKILCALANYDIGEGLMGDMPWYIKHDKRIEKGLLEIEKEQFQKMLSKLSPEIQKAITYGYNLTEDKKSIEGKLFKAIEGFGYIIWAIREYLDEDIVPAVEVFVRQHKPLCQLSLEFKSVNYLYGLCRPFVEKVLEKHQDIAKKATKVE